MSDDGESIIDGAEEVQQSHDQLIYSELQTDPNKSHASATVSLSTSSSFPFDPIDRGRSRIQVWSEMM
jgi:hypothetical protein